MLSPLQRSRRCIRTHLPIRRTSGLTADLHTVSCEEGSGGDGCIPCTNGDVGDDVHLRQIITDPIGPLSLEVGQRDDDVRKEIKEEEPSTNHGPRMANSVPGCLRRRPHECDSWRSLT